MVQVDERSQNDRLPWLIVIKEIELLNYNWVWIRSVIDNKDKISLSHKTDSPEQVNSIVMHVHNI